MKYISLTAFVALLGCTTAQAPAPGPSEDREPTIDERSYQLGVIGAFAEVVGLGVKRLALSSAMSPEDMDALIDEAEKIIARNDALSYREADFLVTDLFPEEVTAGKQVILIYNDPVRDEYLTLKERKQKLIDDGRYRGEERKEIAREMGRLLSYPEERIERMLSESE
ncbi:MAG: hypothetical protein BMS9Abin37_0601 [Acidobacteriota bacterium]|nr:MAG: hypothetical protein BMS9Abin37_0601 [Acidobacteriota bacterium]